MKKQVLITIVILGLVQFAFANRPKEFSKNPIRVDFDMESIEKPKEVPTGYLYDWIDGSLFQPFRKHLNISSKFRKKKQAVNVNVLDEVPDSSWYTNRDVRRMSLRDVVNGPNSSTGPVDGQLEVIKGKSVGVTPGFWLKDEAGDIYIIKFDHPDYPELASGAEVISTKLFYALGYNVPENYLFNFRPEQLKLSESAKISESGGKKRRMTRRDLAEILSKVARRADGSYRVVASKLIKGKPVGGFTFSGKRKDDANDIIPHQMRRELRGLRMFSAWTEHNDIRVGNTLDMFVEDEGRSFVRHYLIDFGSTLGSDTVEPNVPEAGHEHRLDLAQAQKILLTAGLRQPKWRSEKHDPVFSPAVGRYSTKSFHPRKWKSNFPLLAFSRMTDKDAYWASRKIAQFDREKIEAIVKTARFTDPKDTAYLTEQILARKNAIVRYYTQRTTGVDNLAVTVGESTEVVFDDLRREFDENESTERAFSYEIKDLSGGLVGRGVTIDNRIRISSSTIQAIAGLGTTQQDKGISRLTLKRAGEKRELVTWLWATEDREIKIAGIVY